MTKRQSRERAVLLLSFYCLLGSVGVFIVVVVAVEVVNSDDRSNNKVGIALLCAFVLATGRGIA
jgi:hypothetical protein